jgi:hypothetical protein
LLGAACALAISGKYVGVVALIVAIPALLWPAEAAGEKVLRTRSIVTALCGFIAIAVLVNWPMFRDLATFRASFGREVNLVATGQGEVTRSIPHALYWNVFVDNTSPLIWILMAAFLCERWRHRGSMAPVEKAVVLFPFAFAIALSFSPKENDRYFLPATALFTLFAAMGVEDFPRMLCWGAELLGWSHPEAWIEGKARGIIVASAAVALVTIQLTGWWPTKPGWTQYDRAFQRDDQMELFAWMQTELPTSAVVAADSRVGLPDPRRKKNAARGMSIPQKLLVSKLAADLGTLEELRAKGVTHVAVSESSYGRFFRGGLRAKDESSSGFNRGRAFYERLFREGTRVFDRERGTVIYLHPGIIVYRIVDGNAPADAPLAPDSRSE